jgi:transposase
MYQTAYIGIDVSKQKLDTALSTDGKTILSYAVFDNNLAGFKKLLNWTKIQKFQNKHFCLEATGIYSDKISEFLQKQPAAKVSVINPFQAKAFSGCRMIRTKNDKVDSQVLALYCAINQPKENIKIPDEIKKLRNLTRHLSSLIDTRASEKNKLESMVDSELLLLTKQTINFLSGQILLVEKLIKNHIKQHKYLKKNVDLLKTIPGIADRSAWNILSEIYHLEEISIKAQVAHAGLAPKERSSGSSVRGKTMICKTGNSNLRKALYMPAMVAAFHNPLLKEFYQRLVSKGKPKKVALTAVMRKLLTICLGILNHQQPFNQDWAISQQHKFAILS